MKNIIVILAVAFVLTSVYWWLRPASPVPEGFSTLPQIATTTETTPTPDRVSSGDAVPVNNPVAIGDELGGGAYEISGNGSGIGVPFNITYFEEYDYYQIALEQEPLAEIRRAAEERFVSQLGVSEADACALAVSVRTRREVNDFYAGTELGLSFCPGSVRLE
jgi:hypothetical protein